MQGGFADICRYLLIFHGKNQGYPGYPLRLSNQSMERTTHWSLLMLLRCHYEADAVAAKWPLVSDDSLNGQNLKGTLSETTQKPLVLVFDRYSISMCIMHIYIYIYHIHNYINIMYIP